MCAARGHTFISLPNSAAPLKLKCHRCPFKKLVRSEPKVPFLWRGKARRVLWGGQAKPPGSPGSRTGVGPGPRPTSGHCRTCFKIKWAPPPGASRTEIRPVLAQGGPGISSVATPFLPGDRNIRRGFIWRQNTPSPVSL